MFERFRNWLGRKPAPVMPAPDLWQQVELALPFLAFLEEDDRTRLRTLASAFLARKRFHGAHGMPVDDRMVLTIALQACLPVLRIGLDAYRGWSGVVVYPGDFVVPRQEIDEDGIVHEYQEAVLGEAWEGGPVLIGWFDRDDLPDGINVVIHEFAHKLDMENGGADGCPPLPADMSRRQWAQAFNRAYTDFQARVDRGEETLLDPYGAEHPGEFFAVASEAFFEWPCALQAEYPEVYDQLSRLYGVDPAAGAHRLQAGGAIGTAGSGLEIGFGSPGSTV